MGGPRDGRAAAGGDHDALFVEFGITGCQGHVADFFPHTGVNGAGADGVDGDAGVRQLDAEVFGQVDDGGFGGVVGGVVGAADAGHIDDAPAAPFQHRRDGGATAVVGAEHVDGDGVGPAVGVKGPEGANLSGVAGVVHQHVDDAVALQGLGDGVFDLRAVGDVGKDRDDFRTVLVADVGGGFLQLRIGAGSQGELRALGGVGTGDGLADAASAAGDEGNPAVQSFRVRHCLPPACRCCVRVLRWYNSATYYTMGASR